MKVFLRKGTHSAYNDLVKHPPEGVEYMLQRKVIKRGFLNNIKSKAWAFYTSKTPPYLFFNAKDAQIIHSTAGLLIRNKMPWVIDVESDGSFVKFHYNNFDSKKYVQTISSSLESDYCKKIIPWTNACKSSIENRFHSKKINEKMEVVHPAINPVKDFEKIKAEKFSILFVGKNFYSKGCREVLRAYELLRKKYDIELNIVCDVPENFKKIHDTVTFYEPKIKREDLINNFFKKADLFIFPSYMDTYGMVLLEAMATKTPIITTNIFASPEIIGNAGILIDTPIQWHDKNYQFSWGTWKNFEETIKKTNLSIVVENITTQASKLIEDDSLRKRLSIEARKRVETGEVSIPFRNKKLKRIYEESVN